MLVDGHSLLPRAWFGFTALLRKAQVQHADGFEIFVVFDSESGPGPSPARTAPTRPSGPPPNPA